MSRGRNELLAKHAGDHRLRHDRGRAVAPPARFHLYLSWGGIVAIGAAAALVLARGEGLRALVLGAFLAISAALVASRRFLPLPFSLLFVLACLLGAAGYVWPALNDLRFYDNLAHLLMTFALAPALGLLLYRPMLDGFARHGLLFATLVASIGLAVGALWEVFEYATGVADPPLLAAAMHDLCSDTVGAALGGGLAAWYVRGRYGEGRLRPLSMPDSALARKRLPHAVENEA
jgi:hypothetical protein